MHLSTGRLPVIRRRAVAIASRAVPVVLLVLVGASPAAAVTAPVTSLSITTPYPAVSIAPGSKASFTITVNTNVPARVDLALSGVPEGWTATLTGGGTVVAAVQTNPETPPTVRLDVTPPPSAAANTYRLVVTATTGSLQSELPIDVVVSTSAGGEVTLETDFPSLRGTASSSFTFNLTLRNGTTQDLTFGVNAQGEPGWTVTARPASQTQASAFQVNAGSSTGITVTASAPANVAAGTYPILVTATAEGQSVGGQLQVEITGSFSMELTTPDGRLNANGPAGGTVTRTLLIRNTGTGPLTNVTMSQTLPSGWKVTYDPAGPIAQVLPDEEVTVTAVLTPATNAIAGDYVATFRAQSTSTSTIDSTDIRVTIETPLNWLVVGGGVIVLVLIGLGWVFQRYGRR